MEANYTYSDISKLKTPCFIIDENEFKSNITGFSSALSKYFNSMVLGYSVKTNSLPYILEIARQNGCFAEVVSKDEYILARKIGYPVNHIIYNGPMKTEESFLEAVSGGAYVNIENFRELEWLRKVPKGINYHLGVRVNINFNKIGVLEEENAESRFGFSFENGELKSAIEKITGYGLSISGLHLHRTSTTRGLNVYKSICEYINLIVETLGLKLSYVDIGGGFFGNMPEKPDYNEYAKVISENIYDKNLTVIVEPGNGLIASPIDYVMSILDTKEIDGKLICSTDGTRLDVDPFFHKNSYWCYCLTKDDRERDVIKNQKITGATCLENDVIMNLSGEKQLKMDDKIVCKCVGAYTMTLTPNFINYLPYVYSTNKKKFFIVREKWTADNYMQNNILTGAKQEKNAVLFTNAGRRGKLMSDFVESIGEDVNIIASDNWSVAPALFKAHKYYLTPKINEDNYIDSLLDICKKENVRAITSLIDPEIQLIARNASKFKELGIIPLCPSEQSADLCFDKFKMYEYLRKVGIRTVRTFGTLSDFNKEYENKTIEFPVFIKPRTGSGSVGAEKVSNMMELEAAFAENKSDYIIQEYMNCEDCDADVYIDALSHKVIAAFSKRKIETRIGGASKTISFKDERLFSFIEEIVEKFEFSGAVDMDFFYKEGKYYLSEINPRFGGAYLHAYGAGVDFPKMVRNNMMGIENVPEIGNYKENVIMLMYDDVVITDVESLKGDYKNAK